VTVSIINFRDFGGMVLADGRQVASGQLFRSGQSGPLGNAPFDHLVALRLRVCVDMRFPDEVEQSPMPWPHENGIEIVQMEDGERGDAPHHAFFSGDLVRIDDVHRLYANFYRSLPADARFASLVRRSLSAMADKGGPALIHCSAGKDRTGFLAALVLDTLGVDQATIVRDFTLSARAEAKAALLPEIQRRFALQDRPLPDAEVVDTILGVTPDYLGACFAEMERSGGTTSGYLESIGVDRTTQARLRDRFIV
jgi:protein tyrosine/serine phosphatase